MPDVAPAPALRAAFERIRLETPPVVLEAIAARADRARRGVGIGHTRKGSRS